MCGGLAGVPSPGPPALETREIQATFPRETTNWKRSSQVMSSLVIWRHSTRERLVAPIHIVSRQELELSKVIRVRYEKGVLRPLEKLDLEEGEELVVFIRKRRVGKVLDEYVGMFGEADVEELKKYEEEAQAQ